MEDRDALIIAISASVSALLVFIIIFGCCYYFRRVKKRRSPSNLINATDETPLIQVISRQTKERSQTQKNTALVTCHFYVRTDGNYTFHSQLQQLGSNPEKNWFIVSPIASANTTSNKVSSYILTLEPKSDRLKQWTDELSVNQYARTLNSLFSRIYHPYVEPIDRVAFLYTQNTVITVKQYQRAGSLKDLIHRSVPTGTFNVRIDSIVVF